MIPVTPDDPGGSPQMTISLTVNGSHHEIRCNPSIPLVRLLREHLRLTGTKIGCGTGHCGACTVILNGRAVRSCTLAAGDAQNATILTVEGLSGPGDTLHPLQSAFLETGAVQCGFCTPGMLMSALALLQTNPSPTSDDIRKALRGNLCRCTGYQPIEEAILLASRWLAESDDPHRPSGSLQPNPAPRIDGPAKVTGSAVFTADIPLVEPLYGAIFRTPVPCGTLHRLNLDRARAVPGVRHILTAGDIPGINAMGRWRADRPVFAEHRIRYIGDALALVLADTPDAARTAMERIDADIRVESGVFSTEDALRDKSPLLHEPGNRVAEIRITKTAPEAPPENPGSIAAPDTLTVDMEEITDQFQTPFLEHAVLEPENAAAWMDGECLVVAAPSQNVYFDRLELMRILGIPPRDIHRIRVIESFTGGAFGKHEDLSVQPYAALGTFLTHRPVRIILNRDESFRSTTKRHPMFITHRSTLGPDHRVIRQDIHIRADTGAYASWAPNILRKSAVHATGSYAVPNVHIYGESVYTNNAFSGAFRGFGAVQAHFAAERHMDRIARRRNIDPLEFRCRNGFNPGDATATGQILSHITPVPDLLRKAAEKLPWPGPSRGRRIDGRTAIGVGIAAGFYGIGYGNGIPDKGQVELIANPDGTLDILTSAIDYGQGAATIFAQLASETLKIPMSNIRVTTGDTARTPDSGSTVASRQTMVTGNAVLKACHSLIDALRTRSGKDGPVRVKSRVFLESETLDPASGRGDVYRAYATTAAAAEVSVDRVTGTV
ncbi:MAG TPA: molybdopterin-dependent oxidoreductase, partial [bacterium]|nr:molybdopterin-dependent oxidoreductase [bacterium]